MTATVTIVPPCPVCGAKMDFDKRVNVLRCPSCGKRKGAKSWHSDQGRTLNVVIARRGPVKQFPRKFLFQATDEQYAQIVERGGADYLRSLLDMDR